MSLTEENKAIQIIGFDNKKKNYQMWVTKFRSAATLRGYSMILVEKDPKIPKHDKVLKDKDTDTDKENEKLRKANEKAYCKLILACQGPIAFNIVRKCTMDELPTGNTYLVWNKLKERFDLWTSNEKLQLKEKFTNSKLKDWKKSPDDWITELDIIVSQLDQMGHKNLTRTL